MILQSALRFLMDALTFMLLIVIRYPLIVVFTFNLQLSTFNFIYT